MEEPTTKKCYKCKQQDSHPVYDGMCEDCYADKLTRAYGRRHRDRGAKIPYATRSIDPTGTLTNFMDRLVSRPE